MAFIRANMTMRGFGLFKSIKLSWSTCINKIGYVVPAATLPAVIAYIPLIVVNCIILGRAEAFACSHGPVESLFDGIGIGLGFSIALTLLGAVRELLGAGSIFGIVLLPETSNMLLFILPPGAFITLGYLIAIVNRFKKA